MSTKQDKSTIFLSGSETVDLFDPVSVNSSSLNVTIQVVSDTIFDISFKPDVAGQW